MAICHHKCIDSSVAKIADKQLFTETAEIKRCFGDAPRRIELSLRSEPLDQVAVGVENVDKPVTSTSHVVVLCIILFCVGHDQIAMHVRDSKGRESVRYFRISKIAAEGGRLES